MSISFIAGRAERQGESNTILPKESRGQISLSSEDGLTTFRYTNLLTSISEDELILFPGDAKLELCGIRCIVLKFSSSSARHFYWFQDISNEQDEQNIIKVNELINGEAFESESLPESIPATLPTPIPAAPVITTSELGTAEQMLQLQNLINSMSGGVMAGPSTPEFSLSQILTPKNLPTSLLSTHLDSLSPYIPNSMPLTTSTLSKIINSQDFKSSVASFDRALRTGALGPLLIEFGLNGGDAGGLEEFLNGVQRQGDEFKEDKMEE